jgi:hypothetical protein
MAAPDKNPFCLQLEHFYNEAPVATFKSYSPFQPGEASLTDPIPSSSSS